MPVKGDKVQWSDITALYTKLNTARTKFSFSTVTAPSNQGKTALAQDVKTLSNFINEMQSNSFLGSIAASNVNPAVGTLMYPSFLDTLETTINNIQNTCTFGNSSFGDSSFGFGDTGFSFGDTSFSFGNTSFGNSSFGNSSFGFGDTGFSFGNTSFGNSSFSFGDSSFSFGNTSFGNTGFSNSSFGNTGFGDSSFGNTSFGNSSFGNSSFSCTTFNFGFGVWFSSYGNVQFDNR